LAEWKFIPSNFDVRSWIDPRPLEQALAQIELEAATTAKGNSASALQANL
jgi:hypothetical protein